MIPNRRLTFQLTPLLDLLLIVIFAQYLDVESTTRRESIEIQASRTQLNLQLEEALQQIVALRTKMIEMQAAVEVSAIRLQDVERLQGQRDLVGEIVAELFRIPEPAVNGLLQQLSAAGPGPSADDLTQLRRRLQTLAGDSPDRVVDHLLTFGEMRKRIDIWELHLAESGEMTLTVGERHIAFRAEKPEDFATRLYDAYKTLPETKAMVLILLTYGDARYGMLKSTLDSLPLALERIRRDTADRSRFEYAVLGFRPSSPVPRLDGNTEIQR